MTVESKGSRIVAKQVVWRENSPDKCETPSVRISFRREGIIGSGSFGVVQTVNITKIFSSAGDTRVPENGLKLAMKTLSVKRRESRELNILKETNHLNIVKLRFYFYTHAKDTRELKLNLLFDIHQTSLFHLIEKLSNEESRMSSSDILNYGQQILQGLEYLHNKSIAHRDLKPRNLLVDEENRFLQICDLGSACRVGEGLDLNPYICSRFYRAPELLLGSTDYNSQVDIWSVGCVLGEMALLHPLIPGQDTGDQIGEVMDLLGAPTETDLVEMGLQHPGLYYTVGALTDRIQDFGREDRIHKLLNPVLGFYPWISSTLQSILQYNPSSRPTPSQLLAIISSS
ncbi:glycogen synthase kinase-3 isoform X2 [Eurytemora carolleeae]|uniref:glycogen synthase kinase-3 isoform X2 n=1 Tax=Eurytemora carolleeae TaxID=1294199 RepID=UPI000C76B63F|nr:glycogen synthase kinase-3 isoform X2 [Eurytemora carolleeae]|eukprot:XP_023336242.1 glycogen synthase kinase-3-like isoform X2 [Eurytemora affinis]